MPPVDRERAGRERTRLNLLERLELRARRELVGAADVGTNMTSELDGIERVGRPQAHFFADLVRDTFGFGLEPAAHATRRSASIACRRGSRPAASPPSA